jgi:hypothetical protein
MGAIESGLGDVDIASGGGDRPKLHLPRGRKAGQVDER